MRADRPFARLMKIIPTRSPPPCWQGFYCASACRPSPPLKTISCCAAQCWQRLLCKALYPRFAVVAALLVGGAIAVFSGNVAGNHISLAFVARNISRRSLPRHCCSASACRSSRSPWPRKTPRVRHDAGFRLSGARVAADCRDRRTGADTVPFGVYSICIAAITAAICQSPEAHPDPRGAGWPRRRGRFYLLAGLFGGSITALMSALPTAWIQMLAGLALLGTLGGSLFQALNQENERDAAG